MHISYEREFDYLHVGEFRPQRAWCPRSGRYVTVMAAPIIATRIQPTPNPDAVITPEFNFNLDDLTDDSTKPNFFHRKRLQRIDTLIDMLTRNGPMRVHDVAPTLRMHPDTLRRYAEMSQRFRIERVYRSLWLLLPHHRQTDISPNESPVTVQSRILQTLRTENRPMTAFELSDKTGIPLKSVYSTLRRCQHVVAHKVKTRQGNYRQAIYTFQLKD